jgi:hypothetical protein
LFAEVRPVRDGVRVRLRNPGGEAVPATVGWGDREEAVTVAPHGVADVLLRE